MLGSAFSQGEERKDRVDAREGPPLLAANSAEVDPSWRLLGALKEVTPDALGSWAGCPVMDKVVTGVFGPLSFSACQRLGIREGWDQEQGLESPGQPVIPQNL